VWTNASYGQLNSSLELQEVFFNLVQSSLAHPTDEHACSATHQSWHFVATVVLNASFVALTASRRGYSNDVSRKESSTTTKSTIEPQRPTDSTTQQTLRRQALPVTKLLNLSLVELWSQSITGRDILSFPWETTPLGPLHTWSSEIKAIVSLGLQWPERCSMWFGSEMFGVWNDAYRKVWLLIHATLLCQHPRSGSWTP